MAHQLGSIWSYLFVCLPNIYPTCRHLLHFNTVFNIRLYMYHCAYVCVCISMPSHCFPPKNPMY